MEISFQSHFSKFMIHHWRKSDFFNNENCKCKLDTCTVEFS